MSNDEGMTKSNALAANPFSPLSHLSFFRHSSSGFRHCLLSTPQLSCTFHGALLRCGEPPIERERLPERSNGTFVLVE